jgi:hypothetical protein
LDGRRNNRISIIYIYAQKLMHQRFNKQQLSAVPLLRRVIESACMYPPEDDAPGIYQAVAQINNIHTTAAQALSTPVIYQPVVGVVSYILTQQSSTVLVVIS